MFVFDFDLFLDSQLKNISFEIDNKKAFIFIKKGMYFSYNGTRVFYRFAGNKSKSPILLLHGWGSDGSVFDNLTSFCSDKSFLIIDFPPFGKSGVLANDYTIFTYAQVVISLCEHLSIKKLKIIGHSFGGRVAILLCAILREYVQMCILIDSAGLKPKRHLSYYYKIYKYKLYKKLGLSTLNMGSKDYLALSPTMQKTFKSVVNTYLDDYLIKIECPTLILWGEKDKETPLYMAKKLKKKIKNSALHIIKDAGHFCFLDAPLESALIIKEFLEV